MLTYDFAIKRAINTLDIYQELLCITKSMTAYGVIAYMYPIQYYLDKP